MPNFTGVIASARLVCSWVALNSSIWRWRASTSAVSMTLLPQLGGPLRVAHRLSVRGALPGLVEVAAAQLSRVDAKQRRAPAEDVLDHQHPLRAAEPPERRLRGLVGLGDPPVHPHVRDPVRVVDVTQRAGQHRLGEVQAPAAVGGECGVQRLQSPVVVEADPPVRVEAVPLAGHGQVLRAGQPHPHRAAGERGAERGDGGEAVRLHLLAAEPAAHPQALDGDLVVVAAEHVRHDLLRLRRVLGAALHEDLPALVDVGERGVRLEVEVLLAGELDLAAEDVGGAGQAGLDVAAPQLRLAALEALGRDRLAAR